VIGLHSKGFVWWASLESKQAPTDCEKNGGTILFAKQNFARRFLKYAARCAIDMSGRKMPFAYVVRAAVFSPSYLSGLIARFSIDGRIFHTYATVRLPLFLSRRISLAEATRAIEILN